MAKLRERHQPCDECGFDETEVRDRDLPSDLRAMGQRWVVFLEAARGLAGGEAALDAPPHPEARSALEHATVVRDLLGEHFAVIVEWLSVVLPEAPAVVWGTEAGDVIGAVGDEADDLAELLEHLPPEAWAWPVPDGPGRASVAELARRVLHEGYHHLVGAERAFSIALGG